MFSDELNNIDWDETTQKIYSSTDNDVRRALSKAHCNVDDFMAMLSPAAEPYLETMARLSRLVMPLWRLRLPDVIHKGSSCKFNIVE